MEWTPKQREAIFAAPAQITVSAAAGSGKTQVLTSRITERIKSDTSPVSVDRLLIVTFTKAAAAQMRERIAKSLRNAVREEQSAEKAQLLKRQLSLLGGAQISTIDSFCYDIVRKNFFEVDLPADISIGDSGELTLLKLEALEEAVNSFFCADLILKTDNVSDDVRAQAVPLQELFPEKADLERAVSGFIRLTDTCSGDKRDVSFSEADGFGGDYTNMILDLHKKSMAAAYPEKWLDEICSCYNTDFPYKDTFFYSVALRTVRSCAESALKTLTDAAVFSANADIGYEEYLFGVCEKLSALLECDTLSAFHKYYIREPLFPKLSGKKRGCDPDAAAAVKKTIDTARKTVKDTFDKLLAFSDDDCTSLRNALSDTVFALCGAVRLCDKLYFEKMTARRILDFSACAHLALKIISSDGKTLSSVGRKLQARYDEIYIDELQDSNALQDTLFSLISNGRTFMVGDVKQSIYGFRNADPSIFMQKCANSLEEENAEKRKIVLSKNFRSRNCIIDAVNSTFLPIMKSEVCGIDYNADQQLVFGAEFYPEVQNESPCEISLVIGAQDIADAHAREARFVANEISRLVSSGFTVWDNDLGQMRPIRFCDIAVLIRSANKDGAFYESALTEKLIPCYFDGGDTLYETDEIERVIEILKLIDNPLCDIPLASTLRSPMFMFDENELFKIRLASNESFHKSFYGICDGKYTVESALQKKCAEFYDLLSKWRLESRFLSISALLRKIYDDTGIFTAALSFPDGQMRRANLNLLLDKAEEFEQSGCRGLFGFINYTEKVKKTSGAASEAKCVNERMNVVRIMSIHKSKGLEFPVVFLCDCQKSFIAAKGGPGGLILNSRGIALDIIDPTLRCKYPSPMANALKALSSEENTAEEMRLLYVALTRAKEKLYAVCGVKNEETFFSASFNNLSSVGYNEIMHAGSYMKMLALAFGHGADNYWTVNKITAEESTAAEEIAAIPVTEFKTSEAVCALLDFSYRHKASILIPTKASVTQLKSLDIDLAYDERKPVRLLTPVGAPHIRPNKLRREKAAHGTFYGTAHHKMLQYLVFDGTAAHAQRDLLLSKGLLTSDEYSVIDDEKIDAFLSSSLAARMNNAKKLYREEPFVIFVDSEMLGTAAPIGEKICVQGVIDCFFEENDEIVLVDYKTDVYDDPTTIVRKYEKQLFYYEKALRLKFKNKNIKKYLYLFHKNDIMEL